VAPVGSVNSDAGGSSPGGYTPQQIRAAYGFDGIRFGSIAGDGAGQTIAIVDAYDDPGLVDSSAAGFSTSDLAEFDRQFGLPDPPSFTKLNESGNTSPMPGTDPNGPGSSSGNWEYEESMDVEWAHALAPSASIVLVEANSNNSEDLYAGISAAENLAGVSVISLSWGSQEFSGESYLDSQFQTPAGHQGETFVASSGDAGAPGIYPAYSANVLAVGGTDLQLSAAGSILGETAWSGSGGGVSAFESEPSYQAGVQDTGFRTIPDVAFDGSGASGVSVYDSYDNTGGGPWVTMWGTSLGAPSWAALIAVADQGRVAAGGTTLDGPSQTLPGLYALPAADFHDINSGSNGSFSAGTGYDEVTGRGTPVANLLAPDLAFYGMSDHLAISNGPGSSLTAGQRFGLTAEVERPDGSVDLAATGSLTISIADGPGGTGLGGTLTATIEDGVATFSGLSIDQAGSGYSLSVSGIGFSPATSSSFLVTPAAATQLVVVAEPPTGVAAGASFGLTVDVEDAFGNLVEGDSGDVTIALAGGASTELGGALSDAVSDGVASFSGLSIDQAGAGFAIEASAAGLATATTGVFAVTAAAPAQLVIEAGPPSSVTAGAGFGLSVTVEDVYGNVETGYDGSVTAGLEGGPAGAALSGPLTEPASDGVATFSGLELTRAGSGYALTAGATGLASATSSSFSVAPATATKLTIAAEPPTSTTAGNGFGLTLDVEDAFGNLVPSYSGNVSVALAAGPPGAGLGGTLDVAVSGGVAGFSGLMIDRVGDGYTIVASAAGLATATTDSFAVKPAAPAQVVIASGPPTIVTAGAGFGLTAWVEDAYGNLETGYSSNLTVGLAGGPTGSLLRGPDSVAAVGGVTTFSGLELTGAGSGYALSVSGTGLGPATSTSFVVTSAAASQLVLAASPPSSVTAGDSFGLTVDVEDAYGNPVAGYSGVVAVSVVGGPGGGNLVGGLEASVEGGTATFSGLSLDRAGTGYAIKASAAGLATATTGSFGVMPAAPVQLALQAGPGSTAIAGAGFGLTVSVEDAFGNVEPCYGGDVTVGLLGGPAGVVLGGRTDEPVTGGVATFSGLVLTRAGADYEIQASGGGLTAAQSGSFEVSPAEPSQLVVTQSPLPAVTAGAPFSVGVAIEDAFGNVVTNSDAAVSLNLLGGASGADLGGTTSAIASGGVATFDGLTLDLAGSPYRVAASSPRLAGTSTADLSVTPAAPTRLAMTLEPPAIVAAGSGFGLAVSVEDDFGNQVTGYGGDVTVSLERGPAGSGLLGATSETASQGAATFSDLTVDRAGGGLAVQVVAAGVGSLATGTFQVVPAAPSQLVIVQEPPSGTVAGESFGFAVAVEDPYGNVSTGYTGTVAASLARDPAGGSLSGPASADVVGGIATFGGLTLNRAGGGYSVEASTGGLTSRPSSPITVALAAPTRLIVTAQPAGRVDARRAFAVGVEAVDGFGNLATGFDGDVTVALSADSRRNNLRGTLSVQANGGEATFADTSLTKTGKSYAVTITSSGLTPAATSVFNVSRPAAGGGAEAVRRSSRFARGRVRQGSDHSTKTAHDRGSDHPTARAKGTVHVRH
jgi:hypothetical protein